MMKTVVLCAVACLLMVAAVSGDCDTYKEGEKWQTGPPDTCAEYSCKNGFIKGKTCPAVVAPDGCKELPIPAGSVFPDCCPKYDCP